MRQTLRGRCLVCRTLERVQSYATVVLLLAAVAFRAEQCRRQRFKSHIDGQILQVRFNDGDAARKGQVLFEIDPRSANAQLKQAHVRVA